MHFEILRAKTTTTRKVHHSATTLARWKVGAAAWSKAHHGQVYRGQPNPPVVLGWSPLRYQCEDIALEASMGTPMLTGEALPEFDTFVSVTPPEEAPALDIAGNVPVEEDGLLAGPYVLPPQGVGPIGGLGAPPNGPVSPTALLPVVTPRSPRLQAPKHPPQEVTLLPVPLPPPTVLPTPEPSALVLLGTGLATLGLRRIRGRLAA